MKLYTIKYAAAFDGEGNAISATDLVYLTYEHEGAQLIFDDEDIANIRRIELQENDSKHYYKVVRVNQN